MWPLGQGGWLNSPYGLFEAPSFTMHKGLETTFQYLTRTDNPAAVELLEAALDCPYGPVRELALTALLARPNRAIHRRLFGRLAEFDSACKAIFAKRPDRLTTVVGEIFAQVRPKSTKHHGRTTGQKKQRAACGEESPANRPPVDGKLQKDFVRACEAVREFRLYDALPSLVEAAQNAHPSLTALAAGTVLEIMKAFYAELSAAKKCSKDLKTLRTRLTEVLQSAACAYKRHGRKELLEAFLMVAKPQDVVLRRILHDRKESAHEPLVRMLTESDEGGVIRLLLAFLEDPQTPQAALEVIGRRTDVRFVQIWAEHAGYPPPEVWKETLGRIRYLAWAEAGHPLWAQLDGPSQAGCIGLLLGCKIERSRVFQILEFLLQEGKPEGRRAAVAALEHFPGAKADALVVRTLDDRDPYVQAEAIRQVRRRNVPDALSRLIRLVETDQAPVREALQEALPEFSCKKFLRTFEHLPDEFRQTAGYLVRKIDFDAPAILLAEIQSLSPVRRRRAVEAASAMGAVGELETAITPLLQDEDHRVRIAAAKALADSRSQPTWEALRDALFDRSLVVREEAEKSLQKITASLAGQLEMALAASETPSQFSESLCDESC